MRARMRVGARVCARRRVCNLSTIESGIVESGIVESGIAESYILSDIADDPMVYGI